MEFFLPSFLAGLLTVLAPCVLSLLPVILGGTLGERNRWRPLIIVGSLSISVLLFTLLLKATTALIMIPPEFWRYFSGTLITFFALTMIFPNLWNTIAFKLKLYKSEELLSENSQKQGLKGAVLLGASLGPVFTTCSPTYTVILAIVLPQNFLLGLTNLLFYTLGLTLVLLIIGYGGQRITSKFRGLSNPNGLFKKILGIILLATGLLIFTGYDKVLEQKILDSGYLGPIEIEQNLLKKVK